MSEDMSPAFLVPLLLTRPREGQRATNSKLSMRTNYLKKRLAVLLLPLAAVGANAADAFMDGIYYNLNSDTKQAEATDGDTKYEGEVTIPSSIIYNETTYTTAIKTIEEPENKNYNRIYFGYAPTKFSTLGESVTMHGCDLGWMIGLNVTKGRCLPLYIEAGIAVNADFGDCLNDDDKLINLEIPFGVTYRLNIPNTKIYISPFFGFHFKINTFWADGYNNSYFDLDGAYLPNGRYTDFNAHRFQFGMQLGGHIEFDHFYLGISWDKDFISIANMRYNRYGFNLNTSGVRVNIGCTF